MIRKLMVMEERIVLDGSVPVAAAEGTAQGGSDSEAVDSAAALPVEQADCAADAVNDDTDDISATVAPGGDATDGAIADSSLAEMVATINDAATNTGQKVLLINADIEGVEDLIDSVGAGVMVITYDGYCQDLQDVIAELECLTEGGALESIGIITHGSAGELYLTSEEIVSAESLATDTEQQEFFTGLGGLLSAEGRIDLISCDTGGGELGAALIAQVEDISGVSVTASIDDTGNESEGGDWMQERGDVDIESEYFDSTELADFSGILSGATDPIADFSYSPGDATSEYGVITVSFDETMMLNPDSCINPFNVTISGNPVSTEPLIMVGEEGVTEHQALFGYDALYLYDEVTHEWTEYKFADAAESSGVDYIRDTFFNGGVPTATVTIDVAELLAAFASISADNDITITGGSEYYVYIPAATFVTVADTNVGNAEDGSFVFQATVYNPGSGSVTPVDTNTDSDSETQQTPVVNNNTDSTDSAADSGAGADSGLDGLGDSGAMLAGLGLVGEGLGGGFGGEQVGLDGDAFGGFSGEGAGFDANVGGESATEPFQGGAEGEEADSEETPQAEEGENSEAAAEEVAASEEVAAEESDVAEQGADSTAEATNEGGSESTQTQSSTVVNANAGSGQLMVTNPFSEVITSQEVQVLFTSTVDAFAQLGLENPGIYSMIQDAMGDTMTTASLVSSCEQCLENANMLLEQMVAQLDTDGMSLSGSGATAASEGSIVDIVQEAIDGVVQARGAALIANDLLRILAINIGDASERLAENSFSAGVSRLAESNEKLAYSYEVLNTVCHIIKEHRAAGKSLTAQELNSMMPEIVSSAERIAGGLSENGDRASKDVLAFLTRQMQNEGIDKDNLQQQISAVFKQWHDSLGISPVEQLELGEQNEFAAGSVFPGGAL